MNKTKISWTDVTWNPIHGCQKISEGCQNCYAEGTSLWLKGIGSPRYQTGFLPKIEPIEFHKPLDWNKRRLVFVCSMGDFFFDFMNNFEYQINLLHLMSDPRCKRHIFQILTKRHQNIHKVFTLHQNECPERTYENIWIGVTAENQKRLEERAPSLLEIKSVPVRFLSVEPMLGPIDISKFVDKKPGIDWVIIGGESGNNARPMNPHWVSDLIDQCFEHKIPVFFKQWGEWGPLLDATSPMSAVDSSFEKTVSHSFACRTATVFRYGKNKNGDLFFGRKIQLFPVSAME